MSLDYPDEFICPITRLLMEEPVSLECGHTFEKQAIAQWLNSNRFCPTCRQQVTQRPIVNWSLKSMIENATNPPSSNNNNAANNNRSLQVEETASSLGVDEREITNESLRDLDFAYVRQNDKYYLRLDVPRCTTRRPVTFICVIDVSGSMDSPVGKAEGNKMFTRLDIVKHVLSVLIATLHENDNLCLITFSDTSHVALQLCAMNKENKRLAKNHVRALKTFCHTYTGPALKLAYSEIKKAPKNHVKSIILLTDGHDTGGDDMVQHMFDRIQKTEQVQLNTFGFSNDIRSNCLESLAKQGGGVFGFIPDQSMIGTIFINFLANTLLTFAQDVYLELDNNFEFENKGQPKKISLQYGQHRYFLINKKDRYYSGLPSVKLGLSKSNMIELLAKQMLSISDSEIEQQNARYAVLKFLSDPRLPKVKLSDYDDLKKVKLEDFLREFDQVGENSINNEQLKLSLQYWNTWGAHYIKSFAFAHWFEQCLNFKAPSMKIYRYEDFDKLVDEFTDIFCTLPPPEPTGNAGSAGSVGNNMAGNGTMPNFSVSNIMNVNGGCIEQNCKIKMLSGWKKINKVRKNDIVANGAKVLCVIKTVFNGPLISIGKLKITPYHPIFHENKWIFPKDILLVDQHSLNRTRRHCSVIDSKEGKVVYNLVLDTKHEINVEGIQCITLGHGYTHDILKHPYYGTEKVLNELSTFKGWNEGQIFIKRFELIRDENNLVCKTIVQEYGL